MNSFVCVYVIWDTGPGSQAVVGLLYILHLLRIPLVYRTDYARPAIDTLIPEAWTGDIDDT
jgi:hypothetical protein